MEADSDRARVLIVDDERGPRESLRMILAPHYEVVQAESGNAALEILHSGPVDLVTLDLNMPGISGETLMRTLRSEFPEVEVIVITGCGSVESAAEGIRSGVCDYLLKPFDVVQVTAAVVRALARQKARHRLSAFLENLGHVVGRDRDARAILDDVQNSRRLRARLGGLLENSSRGLGQDAANQDATRTVEFLEVLAETIETKDRFMRGHARRVAFYASLLAERLSLSPEEQEHARLCAFLHDLGKVGVPTDLLLRAGALEPAERAIVEQHPAIGVKLLEPLGAPAAITAGIRHHHEWWDGSGYPDGIAGQDIPLLARIVGVADAFDAMTCDRPYRRALARNTVTDELRRYAGVQFDPDVAKALLAILETSADDFDAEQIADAVASARSAAVGV